MTSAGFSDRIQLAANYSIRTVMGFLPMAILVGMTSSWTSSRLLCDILTGWREFEKRCYRTLPPQKITDNVVNHVLDHKDWVDWKLFSAFFTQGVIGSSFWLYLMNQAHSEVPFFSIEYGYFFLSGFLSVTLDYLYEGLNVGLMHCCERGFQVVSI